MSPQFPLRDGRPTMHRAEMILAGSIVFFSPFNVLRVPGVFFTASDIFTLLAFFYLLVSHRLSLTPFGRFSAIWYGGFLALASGLLIGSIANHRLVEGAEVLAQYFFAMIIVPIAIGRRTLAECHTLLGIFVLSIFCISLHGVYLMDFVTDPPENFVSGSGRLRGVVERSNEAAAIGATALLAAIYLSATGHLQRIVALPAIVVILYGITLTASNTGIIAAVSGLIAFTALQCSGRHVVNLAILTGCIMGMLAIFGTDILPASFANRVAGAITSADITQAGTFDGRMELTREGWLHSEDHLMIGLGAEGFREISSHNQPVHNTYILLLVEGGVLSMAGLVILFAAPALLGLDHLLQPKTRDRGAFIVAMAVIFLLVLNAFAHVFARFWIVPVVLVITLAVSPEQQSPYRHPILPKR